ncbi:MAG: hypothetical protein NVS3B5_14020 [Sphingomicrobium sp.]
MRKFLFGVLSVVALGLLALGILLREVIYPSSPKSVPNLHFAGFIKLPNASGFTLFSALDYLTVYNDALFVASMTPGAVYRVPLSSGKLPDPSEVAYLQGPSGVHGVAFDSATGVGFISRSGTNTVDVLDPRGMRISKRIPVAPDADGIFFDPADKLIYLGNGDPNLATLIDPKTQAQVATIKLNGKPEFASFDPPNHLIYQNIEDADSVASIDVSKRRLVSNWPVAGCKGPTGMAINTEGRQLFIVCRNKIFVAFDLNSHRAIASVPIGADADSVDFDPRLQRVYVTGTSGSLPSQLAVV